MIRMLLCAILLSGCWGYSEVDSQATGQAKKVHKNTPIVCPNYNTVDISLGVMKNGVGSMSTQDIHLTIWNDSDLAFFEKAAQEGAIVDVKYSVWRFAPCREDHVLHYAKLAN